VAHRQLSIQYMVRLITGPPAHCDKTFVSLGKNLCDINFAQTNTRLCYIKDYWNFPTKVSDR